MMFRCIFADGNKKPKRVPPSLHHLQGFEMRSGDERPPVLGLYGAMRSHG